VAPHRTFLLELDVQDLEEVKDSPEKFRLMVANNKSKKKVPDLRFKTSALIQLVSTTSLPDLPGLCFLRSFK